MERIEGGSAADTEHKRNGDAGSCQWEGYIGGCVSQLSHSLTDKKLVYNIIQGAYQHGDDTGTANCRRRRETGSVPRGFVLFSSILYFTSYLYYLSV